MNVKIPLIEGLPRKVLFEKVHFHYRHGSVHRRAFAFYLLDVENRGEARALGYAGAVHYAREALGLGATEAKETLRIARALERLVAIDEAFAQARISWSKLREITRIAVPETELEWLEFAEKNSVRRVEIAVSKAKRGERPPKDGGLGTPRTKFRVQFNLSAAANEIWNSALGLMLERCGDRHELEEAVISMAERAIRSVTEETARESGSKSVPIYAVVFHRSRTDKVAWVESEDGPVPVDPGFVDRIEKRAETGEADVIEVDDPLPGEYPAIIFGERGSVPESERDVPVSRVLRRAVLARDGKHCVCCGSRANLRNHHLIALADGGKTRIELLVVLCNRCHSLHHEGLLLLRVSNDGRITPLDRDRRPIRRGEITREILEKAGADGPLTVIERTKYVKDPPMEEDARSVESLPNASPPLSSSFATFDDLPAQLSPAEWAALKGSLDWSASRRAHVVRPGTDEFFDLTPRRRAPATRAVADFPSGSPLRPVTFTDFIGQERAVENLRVAIESAALRGEALEHVLLSGPPGLGKTSLARLIAREMGRPLHTALGGLISDPHVLVSLLTALSPFDVLFIDEIHALPKKCEEALYTALEDRFVDVVIADGARTRALRIRLEPFTLIGATTELGSMAEPLRDRFVFQERLRTLEEEEIVRIVEGKSPRVGLLLDRFAAEAIARRSRGIPREALRLLIRARDVAEVWNVPGGPDGPDGPDRGSITLEHVERAAEMNGVDRDGFTDDDRCVLELLLARGSAVGLESISAATGIAEPTLRSVVEPYLIRKGLIERTPSGRVATSTARAWWNGTSRPADSSSPAIPDWAVRGIPVLDAKALERELRRKSQTGTGPARAWN